MKLFLICDIDKTLISFHHEIAMYRLKAYLKSSSLSDFVQSCFENFLARGRGDPYDQKLVQHIEEMSLCVENHGDSDIYWSRELWLYTASDVAQKSVSAKLAQDAAEAYWTAIGQYARPYADVQEFFESKWWNSSQWELVLVTSSDGRLCLAADGNRLRYDPEYSTEKKIDRIPVALRKWSVPNGIFVGDPVGKPNPQFWRIVTNNIGYNSREDVAVMVGDSAIVDLTNLPEKFVPILINRSEERQGGVKEARFTITSFDSLPILLGNLEQEARGRR